jgi:outer membrane protein assembly factor BamB
MNDRRKMLFVSVFLLIELGLSFYVFNYTARERSPTLTYPSEEEVSCFDISNRGDSLVIGTVEGTVSYYQRGRSTPQWVYEGGVRCLSVLMSANGDYVLSLDENDTIALFRSLGSGVNAPKWTYHLGDGDISGIHVTGAMPALVYMLATEGGRLLLSNRDGLLWEYSTGTDHVEAEISFDGRYVAAVDANGLVYLFDIDDPQPSWTTSTGLGDVVISLSQASRMVVGGAEPSGSGRVYSLSLNDGERSWDWKTASPVGSVSISSDGSRVVVYEEEGRAFVLTEVMGEVSWRQFRVPGGIQSVWAPIFGSYALALGPDGRLFFMYASRSTPLWRYDVGSGGVEAAVTSTGDKVFVAEGNGVAVISNDPQTGLIPGSRALWGGVFFSVVAGLSVIYYKTNEPEWLASIPSKYPRILVGLIAGVAAGLLSRGGALAVFVGGVSCAAGCYFVSDKEGLNGYLLGLVASIMGSLIAAFVYGHLVWFSGVESNIVILTVSSVSEGTRIGLFFGVLGTAIGVAMMKMRSPE